jgi:tRNA 2-thiocytidine biosynthesis protein TtcA
MNIHNPTADLEADGQGYHPIFAAAPKSVEFNKLRKRLLRQARQALDDFAMVKPGERWLVAAVRRQGQLYGLLTLLT